MLPPLPPVPSTLGPLGVPTEGGPPAAGAGPQSPGRHASLCPASTLGASMQPWFSQVPEREEPQQLDAHRGVGRDADRRGSGPLSSPAACGAPKHTPRVERWRQGCKPGPEAGGPQTPDQQLPATQPEPATAQRGHWEPGPASPPSPLKTQGTWGPRVPWAALASCLHPTMWEGVGHRCLPCGCAGQRMPLSPGDLGWVLFGGERVGLSRTEELRLQKASSRWWNT